MSKKTKNKAKENEKSGCKMICPKSGKGLALRVVLGLLVPYAYLMLCGLVFDRWLKLYGMTTFIFFSYVILQILGIAAAVLSIRSYRRQKKGGKAMASVKECVIVCVIVLVIVGGAIAVFLMVSNKNTAEQQNDYIAPAAGDVMELPEVAEVPEEPVEEVTESTEEETESTEEVTEPTEEGTESTEEAVEPTGEVAEP